MLHATPRFADCTRNFFCPRCRSPKFALFACCAIAATAGYVRAEEDVLKLIPGNALGFVLINRPAATDVKLQQLGRQLNLPIPSLLAQVEGSARIRAGLDETRPIALLELPPKDNSAFPAVIALVPVSDYDKFLEQFNSKGTEAGVTKIEFWGQLSLVRKVGAYAAISGSSSREALEKDVKLVDQVPALVAPWRIWLAKKDLAAVVLAPGIRWLSAKAQQGVAFMKLALTQADDRTKQGLATLETCAALFQAAEKEVTSYGLGVEQDAQGAVRIAGRACLVAGGKWSGLFADAKPLPQNVLVGLPDGPFVVAGGGPLPKPIMQMLMDASFTPLRNMPGMYDLSKEQAKMLCEISAQKLQGVRGASFVLGAGPSGEPVFMRTLGILHVDDSEKFMAAYETYLAGRNRVAEKSTSSVYKPVQVEKTEFGGNRALKLTTGAPEIPNLPAETAKLIKYMYGPGGKIVAWVVPCNEHMVVFSSMGQDRLRRAIAAIIEGKQGLAGDTEIAKVAASLPLNGAWRLYVSPGGVCDLVKSVAAWALPPHNTMKIFEFCDAPPIALAMAAGPDEVEAQVLVPVEVVKEIGRLTTIAATAPATKDVPHR